MSVVSRCPRGSLAWPPDLDIRPHASVHTPLDVFGTSTSSAGLLCGWIILLEQITMSLLPVFLALWVGVTRIRDYWHFQVRYLGVSQLRNFRCSLDRRSVVQPYLMIPKCVWQEFACSSTTGALGKIRVTNHGVRSMLQQPEFG